MQTFKDYIKEEMGWLANQEKVVFLGQGITCGDRFYGTLEQVPISKCIEFPVAENLMAGAAIGLALKGYKPIVLFQRMDFMLIAADQIINHASLIPSMSGFQIWLPIIFRACIGSQDKRFDVGDQHRKDLSYIFEPHLKTIPYRKGIYKGVFGMTFPVLIVEKKDSYNDNNPEMLEVQEDLSNT